MNGAPGGDEFAVQALVEPRRQELRLKHLANLMSHPVRSAIGGRPYRIVREVPVASLADWIEALLNPRRVVGVNGPAPLLRTAEQRGGPALALTGRGL
ncbi:hypothetical protein ACFWMT_20460 [Streptomyces sp. NPDC058368]|uniref:hypothetical protein n=1 Tax=Streptomyces sp. NPDC058368 TaxID=3346461 RepID=UPI0036664573